MNFKIRQILFIHGLRILNSQVKDLNKLSAVDLLKSLVCSVRKIHLGSSVMTRLKTIQSA